MANRKKDKHWSTQNCKAQKSEMNSEPFSPSVLYDQLNQIEANLLEKIVNNLLYFRSNCCLGNCLLKTYLFWVDRNVSWLPPHDKFDIRFNGEKMLKLLCCKPFNHFDRIRGYKLYYNVPWMVVFFLLSTYHNYLIVSTAGQFIITLLC